MSHDDRRGVPTSATSAAEVAAVDDAFETFADYEMVAGARVKQLLADHPESVLGRVLRGYMMLMLETAVVGPKVTALATTTLAEADHANERERHHLRALETWAGGDPVGAAAHWDRLLAEHPLDLLALKMHHYTTFWTGRPQVMRTAVEGVLDAWDDDVDGYDHVLGMHAFALNETGHHAEAEVIGRDAVGRNPEDLWSVHAVAHALEMQGDIRGGLDLFDVDETTWATKNPFVGHIWWHAALFGWNGGDHDAVLRLYDERLRPASTDFFLDIQNLASLLRRLELAGVDVGDRWDELADHATARTGDHVLTFTDVHCALALARAGRLDDLARYIASLRDHRDSRPAAIDVRPHELAVELAQGFAHAASGATAEAAEIFAAHHADVAPIGGSDAQRDLFDLIALATTHEAGDVHRACHLARARARRWPTSVPTWRWYATVHDAAGDADAAATATRRAEELSIT